MLRNRRMAVIKLPGIIQVLIIPFNIFPIIYVSVADEAIPEPTFS